MALVAIVKAAEAVVVIIVEEGVVNCSNKSIRSRRVRSSPGFFSKLGDDEIIISSTAITTEEYLLEQQFSI